MGPVPWVSYMHLWDWSHMWFWATYGTSWRKFRKWSPMLGSEVPMGPVPCTTLGELWDRSHVKSKDHYGTSPIYAPENPMGPVPCTSLKNLWDRSHDRSQDTYGTGPIAHMGLQNITSKTNLFTSILELYIFLVLFHISEYIEQC